MFLNITDLSQKRVTFDQYADYIPGVSSVTNLVNIFLKVTESCSHATEADDSMNTFLIQKNGNKDHYSTYLKNKSIGRCLISAIPVAGNIIAMLTNFYYWSLAERALAQINVTHTLDGRALTDHQLKAHQHAVYFEAAHYGSPEGMYQLGLDYQKNAKETTSPVYFRSKEDLESAKYWLRNAAAFGHPLANTADV